jgi:endonuclease/exonuclease/phosphatase family metal-dependent hydrolase
MRLTFASYNIHKALGLDRKRDPDRILAVLRELDADIIALQEADRRFGPRASVIPRASLDDTPWRAVQLAERPRSLGWHGNALLVRRELTIVDAGRVALPCLEPRGAVCAVVELSGKPVHIVGAHLDLSGMRRRAQMRSLLAHCEAMETRFKGGLPSLIMGDFNQWGLSTGAMAEFPSDWQVLTPGRSFPASRPIAQLDRLAASAHWQVEDAGVHHTGLASVASDHLPIWARMNLHKF